MTKSFCENSEQLKVVNSVCKKGSVRNVWQGLKYAFDRSKKSYYTILVSIQTLKQIFRTMKNCLHIHRPFFHLSLTSITHRWDITTFSNNLISWLEENFCLKQASFTGRPMTLEQKRSFRPWFPSFKPQFGSKLG